MTEVVVGTVLMTVVSGVAALLTWLRAADARRVAEDWRNAAVRLGLSEIAVSGAFGPRLDARSGDIRVTVQHQSRKDGQRTLFWLSAPTLLPDRLELRGEGADTALEKLFKGADLATGDDPFDREVLVRGNPVVLTAVLDAPTRNVVAEVARLGGRISAGRLTVTRAQSLLPSADIDTYLRRLLDLVHRLGCPRHPAELLAENAVGDPVPAVRLKNLQLLTERFAQRPQTREVLRQCLADTAHEVRLAAAAALGAEGHDTLELLASAPDTLDHVAASALCAVGPALGAQWVIAILGDALRAARREVAMAALEVLGRLGGKAAVARLSTVLGAGDDELAATAARALGDVGAAVEPQLLLALDRRVEVALAAAESLGRVGSVSAVAWLRATATDRRAPVVLRNAATAAVAAIKERANGAAPGQLALAAGEAGELALAAEDGMGAVTLTDESG